MVIGYYNLKFSKNKLRPVRRRITYTSGGELILGHFVSLGVEKCRYLYLYLYVVPGGVPSRYKSFVLFTHVRAHAGIPGNEAADQLAKAATRSTHVVRNAAVATAIAKVVPAVTPKLVRVRKSAVPKKVSLLALITALPFPTGRSVGPTITAPVTIAKAQAKTKT